MMRSAVKVIARRAIPPHSKARDLLVSERSIGPKTYYWNAIGMQPNPKTPVYCMQFDVSDLGEQDVSSFTATLQSDVSSLKPDIVYIQQTKQSVPLEEIGLRMKGLGYEGYEQKVTPDLKQATYFRSNLLRGVYGNPEVTHGATTG